MRLISLWIENYRIYKDVRIVFCDDNTHPLQDTIFNKMNIILFSGENGSGKTTILSFISYIFRFLQRSRERMPSSYELVYDITVGRTLHRVSLRKEAEKLFITIDGVKKCVQKYRYKREKWYSPEMDVPLEEQVTYDDIREYLPSIVYVMGFDYAYSCLNYNVNYIADRIVEYRDISSTYGKNAVGTYNSWGIVRFYSLLIKDSNIRRLFDNWGLSLEPYVDIHLNIDEGFSYWETQKLFKYKRNLDNDIVRNIYIKSNLESYITDLDSDLNVRFDLVAYLKKEKNISFLSELISNGYIYINEFYICKDKKSIPIANMSTGEKAFLFDLFDLCSYIKPNALIIWEEPETHMNTKWAKNLIPLLVQLFSNINSQWLISSHSPYLIKDLFQNQIFCMEDTTILHPDFNTFLASDMEIYLKLFKDRNENIFENIILKEARKNGARSVYDQLGESYLKLMLLKGEEN